MRFFQVIEGVFALGISLAIQATAQDDAVLPALQALPVAMAEDDAPLLPEVLVQPDEPPTLDPINVTPGPTSDPYDLPGSYPNLMQQVFEGPSSALRSTQSIFESSQAASIVTRQDLMERQPRNMLEALEREVGITMQRTGAGQVSPFIRGLTGPQTVLLIDGIRLNNSTFRFGPNQYFALIDPGMVERIEVVRGPQSVLWGSDAIGGVINVITRHTDPMFCDFVGGEFIQRVATADAGSYSRLNVQASRNYLGVFSGAGYGNFNDLYRGGGLGVQPFTDYSEYSGDIRFDKMLADNHMLTVALQHFEQMNVPRSDKWPGEARRFDPQQRDLGYIRWRATDLNGIFDSFEYTASYGRQKEGTTKRKPPTSTRVDTAEFNVNTTGMSLVGHRDLDCLGSITTGIDAYHDHVTAWKYRNDGGVITPLIPQFPNNSYYERYGMFLEWQVDVTQRLRATSGVRYTNIEAGSVVAYIDPNDPLGPVIDLPINPNFQDWTAMVGLSYEINPCLRFVASISEGFRAPSLDELTSYSDNVNEGIDIPNPDLSPETSIGYEVGLKFDFERVRAQTFVFWTSLDDLIVRELVAVVPDPDNPGQFLDILQRRNVASAIVQGYELAGEILMTPEWSIFGNYTYVYGQDYTRNEPISRIPPAQGTVGLRWRDTDMRNWFDIYTWLCSRQDRLSARDIRDSRIPPGGTPGFGIVNVNVGLELWTNHQLSLGIENILNKGYRVHGSGVDGPGISGHFGYQMWY